MSLPGPNSEGTSHKTSKKKIPGHGRDFDFEMVVRVVGEYETSRTRDRIAYFVLGCASLAMFVAAIYGFYFGNFGVLKDVWAVVGPITGGIIGYYFHRGREASG
jgi:hypothetical protein